MYFTHINKDARKFPLHICPQYKPFW